MSALLQKLPGSVLIGILLVASGVSIAGTAAGFSNVQTTFITVKEKEMPCNGPVVDINLTVKDQADNIITETLVGSQVSIEGSVIVDCIDYIEDSRTTILEVRTKEEGITTFLAWQSISSYYSGEQIEISQSWMPDKPGEYEVRLFSPACLRCPMILSHVATYEITVV